MSQFTLTFKPGPDCGKDAIIWTLEDLNSSRWGNVADYSYPRHPGLNVMEWTWTGIPGRRFGLLDFPGLKGLPPGTVIQEARLSLFHASDTGDGGHSTFDSRGTNNHVWIERIITPWSEETVSWSNQPATTEENRVLLEPAQSPDQDYLDIDVRSLVQDMVDFPDDSHGFLFRMRDSGYYRSMIFASSDHLDADLWPQLKVTYQTVTNQSENLFEIDLGPDTSICAGEEFWLEVDNERFSNIQWSNGTSMPSLQISQAGTYVVQAENMACQEVSDTIRVVASDCGPCQVYFPNVFSPDFDGINDEFLPGFSANCQLARYSMKIFNRWGGLLFESMEPDRGWQGMFQGKALPSDVYVFLVEYEIAENGQIRLIKEWGDVTLLR